MPGEHDRHQLPGRERLPRRVAAAGRRAATYYYLFKHDPYRNDRAEPVPGDDRQRPRRSPGTQADFDPTTGNPIVLLQFTGHGSTSSRRSRRTRQRGKTKCELAGQPAILPGSDYVQHFAIVLDNQLHSYPTIDYTQ